MQYRFDNENILIQKALQGSFFGWGGFGRSRVYDESGKDISVSDGLWIITFGQYGIYGISMLLIAIQWPIILFLKRIKPERWKNPSWGASAVMAHFLGIFMIDNLLNAMINPIYMLFSGSLISVYLNSSKTVSPAIDRGMLRTEAEHKRTTSQTRYISSPNINPSRFIG